MAKQPECLVCRKVMEKGFVTDFGHLNAVHIPKWHEGEPQPSFWTGEASRAQVKGGFKIVAYRCPECEALRLYAPAES